MIVTLELYFVFTDEFDRKDFPYAKFILVCIYLTVIFNNNKFVMERLKPNFAGGTLDATKQSFNF